MARIELNKEQRAQIQNINVKLDLKTNFIARNKYENHFILEDDWIKLDLSQEYKEVIYKYFPIYRVESFFNNLFGYLIKKDYSIDLYRKYRDGLLFRYQKASEKILYEQSSILFNESDINSWNQFEVNFEWDERLQLYGKHFKYIIDDLLSLVNYDKENNIKSIIGVKEDENPYFSDQAHRFAQTFAIIGYSLATKRILDNYENDNYFGIEIMNYNKNSDLIIHLTPCGLLEALVNFEKLSPEERKIEYEKQIKKSGIDILNSESLKQTLDTKAILSFNGKIYKHYKTNEISASESLNSRTNKEHIRSLVVETQSNYSLV